jgi:hypothetical protein
MNSIILLRAGSLVFDVLPGKDYLIWKTHADDDAQERGLLFGLRATSGDVNNSVDILQIGVSTL